MMSALAEFRCSIREDPLVPDELRDRTLEHLDAAFSPAQEENLDGPNVYALPENKLIHVENIWSSSE